MMRALVVIVAAADPHRFATAVGLVAAQAAHGGLAWLHFDAAATPLVGDPACRADLAEAAALGVRFTVCPTGMAENGIDPGPPFPAEAMGLVALIGTLPAEARLLVV
jgi:hypothetical protein